MILHRIHHRFPLDLTLRGNTSSENFALHLKANDWFVKRYQLRIAMYKSDNLLSKDVFMIRIQALEWLQRKIQDLILNNVTADRCMTRGGLLFFSSINIDLILYTINDNLLYIYPNLSELI
jgi:hypothetical protein